MKGKVMNEQIDITDELEGKENRYHEK